MTQNESSTLESSTNHASTTSSPSEVVATFFDHWAWKFHAYFFGSLFGIFALCCFVIMVRQCKQPLHSRNVHGRFTTVQLFVAATLKEFTLLWSPLLLHTVSKEIFVATLLIDSISVALILSAFSILLLILLETTKTSLAPPRLQNIWVLLGITAVLTTLMLASNLLVLYGVREFWYFLSYLFLLTWGILICVGYIIAGRRMWRNLRSSRQLGTSSGDRRLQNITFLVFLSPWITATSLVLDVCLAASQYGVVLSIEITENTIWSRYAITFLLETCQFAIVVLIFGVVVRTKSGKSNVDDAPTVQLGTFTDDEPKTENCDDEMKESA